MNHLTQAPVSAQDALFIAQDLADLAAQGLITEPDRRPDPMNLECPLCQGDGQGLSRQDPETGLWDGEACRGCDGVGQVFDLDEYFSLRDLIDYLDVA